MALAQIFTKEGAESMISRIEKLTPDSRPLWGKMSVAQMLAHCSVVYEMALEPEKHTRPNALLRFILKTFVKNSVVNEVPYSKGKTTAPPLVVRDNRNFEAEKSRLIGYIRRTQELGAEYFEGKESLSFGKMTSTEWNNMFAKHLDHHLTQFGV